MKRDQKLRDRYGYGGNGCRKKENDFRGFTRKILVESTEMCYDTSVGKIHAQIWFIGRTLPLFYAVLRDFRNKLILSNKRVKAHISGESITRNITREN